MRRITVVAAALALVALAGCSSDDGGDDGATSAPAATAADGTSGARTDGTAPADDGTAATGASGELTLLSYNVAGLPQEVSEETPSVNLPLISPRLEPYDLVLTQEDFDWWQPSLEGLDFVNYHDRLVADTTHEYRSERHPGPEAAGLGDWETSRPTLLVGDGLGYLSRYPLSDIERIAWADCFGGADTDDGGAGDCLSMKGFAVATVELAPGVTVDVYDLHNEAGGTDADQAIQARNMEDLAAFMAERSDGRAVILAGDTNLHTDGEHPDGDGDADEAIWSTFLEAAGLTDVCDALSCDSPGDIDKAAFRSGGGVTLEPTSHDFPTEDFQDDAGEDLSDHEPLAVTFAWTTDG